MKKELGVNRLWSYPQILELAHCGPRADRYKWSYIFITPISRVFVDPSETHLFIRPFIGMITCNPMDPMYNWFSGAHLVILRSPRPPSVGRK